MSVCAHTHMITHLAAFKETLAPHPIRMAESCVGKCVGAQSWVLRGEMWRLEAPFKDQYSQPEAFGENRDKCFCPLYLCPGLL